MRKKACIMCGSILESETELARAICLRCKPASTEKEKPLPVSEAPVSTPPEGNAARPPRKILLIDDEPLLLKLLKNRIEAAGYEVITAGDGEEGYGKIKVLRPELILTDLMMPNLTGYDLLKRLQKETDGTQHIPVLVMTAKGGMKDFFETWEIHGFIRKPIDPEELIAKIDALIDTAGKIKRNGA